MNLDKSSSDNLVKEILDLTKENKGFNRRAILPDSWFNPLLFLVITYIFLHDKSAVGKRNHEHY